MKNSACRRSSDALPMRERIRIGKALHEGVAQELAAASFLLASVARMAPARLDGMRDDLGSIKAILERAIHNLRVLARAIAAESTEADSSPVAGKRKLRRCP
jgi:signal transduction histidine kinase